LPLFFEHTATVFDYLPENTLIIRSDTFNEQLASIQLDFKNRHESLNYNIERPILKPDEVCLKEDELFAALNQFPAVLFSTSGEHPFLQSINVSKNRIKKCRTASQTTRLSE